MGCIAMLRAQIGEALSATILREIPRKCKALAVVITVQSCSVRSCQMPETRELANLA